MVEKKQYLLDHLDSLRTSLMYEPRGHNDMFGAYLLSPTKPEAELGIVFMDGGGYLNMCGHNTIAAVVVAIEIGLIKDEGNATQQVVLETPAGLVIATAYFDVDREVEEVSFANVESFLYKKDVKLNIDGRGEIIFDIAFGGSFFVIVNATELGLTVTPNNASKLSNLAMKIMHAVNEQIDIQHPTLPHIKSVDLVEIYDAPTHPEATYKNVVVFGEGQIDRSPCGTGTSAKMATLYAKGKLKLGEPFVYESILGTLFKGKIIEETEVDGIRAIVPEIAGSAYITGYNNIIIDPKDPVKDGFILK
jgi:proline racemase